MQEESPTEASAPAGAVFLSYASQDLAAAQRICQALREAGVEVWFDQSELRGGEIWDQRIRREIRDCMLFVPVISANTASRHEGYFRLEWDLADQRTHMMARNRVFILPVCVDATPDSGADVPDSFQRAQWTRLPEGEVPPAFIARVRRLLLPEASTAPSALPAQDAGPRRLPLVGPRLRTRSRAWVLAGAVAAAIAVGYLAFERLAPKRPASTSLAPASDSSLVAERLHPPPHSIAVLPFVNLSGDPSQEYFTDGLTEELLNSLAAIEGLQVAARTSSFSFKEHPDIVAVAHKLNVAAVLEGSVRRSSSTVRVTAQLIDATTGFHL